MAQRPIAVHALEHLVSSDRGVIMFRKLVRDGVRAVQSGRDPFGVSRAPGEVIPTLGQNTILRIPPAPTVEADRELLRETGRRVARGMYATGQPVGS